MWNEYLLIGNKHSEIFQKYELKSVFKLDCMIENIVPEAALRGHISEDCFFVLCVPSAPQIRVHQGVETLDTLLWD